MWQNRFVLSLALLGACSEAAPQGRLEVPDASNASAKLGVPDKLAIVADWFNGSISYVDVAALAGGATRDAVVTATIDLSAYPPGPIDVALTPDKKTALVSSSTGFFAIPGSGFLLGGSTLPTGAGKLLMLDVASGKVTAELDAGPGPMSIAITPDGKRAVLANLGSGDLNSKDSTLVVVDIATKQIADRIDVGQFAEEIAFDETGTVGIFGYGTAGNLRTFSVADPRGSMSPAIELRGDSAGVAFFPGSKIAFAVQAPGILDILTGGPALGGYTIVDVATPSLPKVLADVRLEEGPVGYPVVPAKNRASVLVPVTVGGRLVLREYKLAGTEVSLTSAIDIADASLLSVLGLAYDEDHTAILAWPAQKKLVVVDLQAQTSKLVPWLTQSGPADVAFR